MTQEILDSEGAYAAARLVPAAVRATLDVARRSGVPDDLDLGDFVGGWDGERVRLLCVEDPARGDFGALRDLGFALLMPSAQGSLRIGVDHKGWAVA